MLYGLAVIEVMSLSGHFSSIDEIFLQNHPGYVMPLECDLCTSFSVES